MSIVTLFKNKLLSANSTIFGLNLLSSFIGFSQTGLLNVKFTSVPMGSSLWISLQQRLETLYYRNDHGSGDHPHHTMVSIIWCKCHGWFQDACLDSFAISHYIIWNQQVLAGIGNTIGHYIKIDAQRLEEWIFTFTLICVEVDLSKGFPGCIQLNHKQWCWTQILDYENTTLRCKICWKDTYKISALKPKKISEERRNQGNNPRVGNSPHQSLTRRRKMMWNNPYQMRSIRWTKNHKYNN